MWDIDTERVLSQLTYAADRPLLFNSGLFFLLFTGFCILYALLSSRRTASLRLLYVTAFSYYFYYKNAGGYCALLAIITLVNYFCALAVDHTRRRWAKRLFLWTAVGFMLGQLAWFKYTNFFLASVAQFTGGGFHRMDIFLPVGISFFTFQSMSYILDVYRGQMRATRNLLDFAFFVSFFPTLLAGPILRARTFLPQLRKPLAVSREMVGTGVFYIVMGLFKKAVVSDYISVNFVSRIFDNPTLYSGLENLLGIYGYALQLYCDFSGYSDMAIGIALWLGFRIPANFNAPYKADSITDFWRRWHISLSSWLRDYLYISLGGNRKGQLRMYVNLFLTMLLGGLWHGASWNFVIWGSVHGAALGMHKRLRQMLGHDKHYRSRRWRKAGAVFLTFHLVCFCWLFFAGSSLEASTGMLTQIFTNFNAQLLPQFVEGYPVVTALMAAGFVLHFLPTSWTELTRRAIVRTPLVLQAAALAAIIFLVVQIKGSDIQPFIYFQF